MSFNRKSWILATFAALVLPATVLAQSYAYTTDSQGLSLSSGSATVKVYLDDPSGTIGSNGGLLASAFSVTRIRGTAAKITALAYNPSFDAASPFNAITVADSVATLYQNIGDFSPAVTYAAGLGNKVYLGSVTITADPTGFGATSFRVDRFVPLPETGWIVTNGSFISIDASPISTTAFGFITTVPEPTAALSLLVPLAMISRRR